MPHSPQSRPLDALAIAVILALCLTWGFNQVAIKYAIAEIPPLTQAAVRSVVAALFVGAYARLRGIRLFKRDGTLPAGITAGVLFALEFFLIYRGLHMDDGDPRRAVPLSGAVLRRDRIALVHSRRPFLSFAMVRLVDCPLSASSSRSACRRPAADPRQTLGDLMMVGSRRRLGGDDARHQGQPA